MGRRGCIRDRAGRRVVAGLSLARGRSAGDRPTTDAGATAAAMVAVGAGVTVVAQGRRGCVDDGAGRRAIACLCLAGGRRASHGATSNTAAGTVAVIAVCARIAVIARSRRGHVRDGARRGAVARLRPAGSRRAGYRGAFTCTVVTDVIVRARIVVVAGRAVPRGVAYAFPEAVGAPRDAARAA